MVDKATNILGKGFAMGGVMDKRDLCVNSSYTIMDVMQVFERNKERGVVVISDNGKVCGFLSMGDIINLLVEGYNIYTRIEHIYHPSFIYLDKKDYDKAIDIFLKRNVSLIPVLDEEMNLEEIITEREILRRVREDK